MGGGEKVSEAEPMRVGGYGEKNTGKKWGGFAFVSGMTFTFDMAILNILISPSSPYCNCLARRYQS